MSGKRCSGCGEVKGVEAFSRNKSSKDGLQSRCRDCNRRYYEENRDALLARQSRYREGNREEISERNRRYYEKNRDALLARHRRYHEENREAKLELVRRYREENREAISERKRRYREENRGAIAESDRRYRKKNRDMTREAATRNGEPYTPAEDAHILTSDEPIAVIAVELGRTLISVRNRRRKLRNEVSA